jgi:hypothetical protein
VSTQETDRHLVRLLQLQASYSKKVDQLLDIGVDLDSQFDVIQLNLLDVALDMLGVPADNSGKWDPADGDKEAVVPDWLFCRDWFTETFFDTVNEGTALECMAYIESTREMIRKGYNQ